MGVPLRTYLGLKIYQLTNIFQLEYLYQSEYFGCYHGRAGARSTSGIGRPVALGPRAFRPRAISPGILQGGTAECGAGGRVARFRRAPEPARAAAARGRRPRGAHF